jgi:hypothetical protein
VVRSDFRGDFVLDIGFTDHFNTQLVITLNYSSIADLHTLRIAVTHAKSFPARSVFTSNYLVAVSNNGCSFASGLKSSLDGDTFGTDSFLHRHPYLTRLLQLSSYYSSTRPAQTTPFILVCVSVAVGTCLPSHSLAAAVLLKNILCRKFRMFANMLYFIFRSHCPLFSIDQFH